MFLIYHLVHLVNPIFYGCYYTNSPTTPFVPGGNCTLGDGAYYYTLGGYDGNAGNGDSCYVNLTITPI